MADQQEILNTILLTRLNYFHSLVPGGGEWREWEELVLPHVVKELLHNLMFSL
jgi:hypothetical protein